MQMTFNIELRTLLDSDQYAIAKLADNKKVWDNLKDVLPTPYTLEDAQEFILVTKAERPKVTFGILYNNELCGIIGLVLATDIYRRSAEIGYWLGEQYWGKGIATEAIRLITEYGFEQLDLVRIYTGVMAHNTASMRALEKNGYKKEGVFKMAIFKNNQLIDEHRFAKTIKNG
jgi:[ribosomal protein S5]-alanine N-acetyltransferase